ncbi:Retrovirus-related Pol polyprotein from transposon TNT 1-94 [Sesamum angolense]|uniref:Retrovirus-related Pol polyprotein from transposon TNT 1-94 n=1 Tax=Sesamum angolense TaxID=2727404 RepID=A0AAE2BRV9_9LAMI|nr:Retrovirus-related Pol polyprotein from transposon TNT 1-94 [Sesamum angolense]
MEKDCRLKGNHQANCIEENNSSDQLFYTCNSVAETGEATWYIDSAASNHMTYNKGAFQTLDESFKTNVKLGDNHIVKVEGKGSVAINTKKDLPQIQAVEGACEACLQGKQHKKPFPSRTSWRAKAVLELIHTDVCGPMRTPSHEQNRYFILFIDDYSRMTWVYFMREKSEVFKVFKKFKNLVEKQSGRSIKVLRSDRGKEYNNSEFDKFCEEEGIEHQTTYLLCTYSNREKHKLEEKTEKGIFLGYNTQSKGYRIYHLKTKKLIISRDVEFDEDAMWNWDEEKVERQSVMIPKETPPQQQEEGTDQAEMERRSQQAPVSPRRPPPSEEIEEETRQEGQSFSVIYMKHATSSYWNQRILKPL